MQYEPLASETAMLASAGDLQRLDYFLLRAFETEEIWTLKQGNQWFSREVILPGHDPVIAMPLWPYRKMALDAALDVWDDCRPEATSLEYFMEELVPSFIVSGIQLDVMPREDRPGCLITAEKLNSILEGIMDAGEYRLDG
tara:strand:+ start:1126 stop:1548 length:423 start_codon:yes stop_codon:yes gene_type:complete